MIRKNLSISSFKKPRALYVFLFLIMLIMLDKSMAFFFFKKQTITYDLLQIPLYRRNLTIAQFEYGKNLTSPKKVCYSFDKNGYRNLREVKSKDILITGDSFALSSEVSDKYSITEYMYKMGHQNIYNIASKAPLDILKEKTLPKKVFYLKAERDCNKKDFVMEHTTSEGLMKKHLRGWVKLSLINLIKKQRKNTQNKVFSIKGTSFLEGSNKNNKGTIDNLVLEIVKINDLYQQAGVAFVVVPIPSKYSFYLLKNDNYNNFLYDFYKILDGHKIKYINILDPLSEYKLEDIYLKYGTHCNEKGYQLIAEEMHSFLKSCLN